MKSRNKTLVFVLMIVSALGYSQNAGTPARGAKALFFDQTSGATLQPENGKAGETKKSSLEGPRVNMGLHYWVELLSPNGAQIERVSTNHVFHSGERIRLHFESNIDGRIELLQTNPNGTSQMIFPDSRINNGDNHIRAMADTIVPPGDAWFTFDNNPGTEHILVYLRAEAPGGSPSAMQPSQKAAQSSTPEPNPAGAGSPLPSSPDGKFDARTTSEMIGTVRAGSKSLVLDPAGFAVKIDYKQTTETSAPPMRLEIQMKHQ